MIIEDTGLLLRICAQYLFRVASVGCLAVLLFAGIAYGLLNIADSTRENVALLFHFSGIVWIVVFAIGCSMAPRIYRVLDRRFSVKGEVHLAT